MVRIAFDHVDKHICVGRFLWQLTVMHLIHYKQLLPKATLHVNMPFRYKAIPQVVTLVSNKATAVRSGERKGASTLCICSYSVWRGCTSRYDYFCQIPFMSDVLDASLHYICGLFSSRPLFFFCFSHPMQANRNSPSLIFRHITRRKLNFLIPGGSRPNLKRSRFWNSFTFPLRLNGTGWEEKELLCLPLSAPDLEVAIMQGACWTEAPECKKSSRFVPLKEG